MTKDEATGWPGQLNQDRAVEQPTKKEDHNDGNVKQEEGVALDEPIAETSLDQNYVPPLIINKNQSESAMKHVHQKQKHI